MNQVALVLVLITAAAGLSACGSTEVRGGAVAGAAVPIAGRVCYMPVADGSERGGPAASGSGAAMTAAIRDDLVERRIEAVPLEAGSLRLAGAEARGLGCTSVLRAVITEWEDNATEWSGKGDSIGLSAELFDAESLRMLSTASVREKASALAFVSRSPERFAQVIASDAVAKLFGLPLSER